MKLPISFGSRLFLRLLIPGAIAAFGLVPGLMSILLHFKINIGAATVFAVTTLLVGWFINLIDMPIYMLFEGRRFWPEWIRKARVGAQQKKLDCWLRKAENHRTSNNAYAAIEYDIRAYRYPVGGGIYPPTSGRPIAVMPTELGNVIYGFETYATVKYGVDGIFFWDRILMALDENLRKHLDDQQALCDSALYASFSCVLGSLLFTLYWVLAKIWNIGLLNENNAYMNLIVAAFLLVLSIAFYKAAISTNGQFGERIKAMFDIHLDKISIDRALDVIGQKTGTVYAGGFHPDKVMAAWRYLRWHEYKKTPGDASEDIEDVFASRRP